MAHRIGIAPEGAPENWAPASAPFPYLYYADDGKIFRAASQVKALLAGESIDTAPNPAGHVGFFLWGHVPDPHTLYRNIRAVPAGTSLWLQQGKSIQTTTFFSVPRVFADTVKDPRDTPNFSESTEAGGDIALGQEYIIWWWWCWILREVLAFLRQVEARVK